MISIIVCSRKPDISLSLRENITKTIGTEYELIIIDNSKNNYSIFSAYNLGVKLAKYPFLCFIHEDILFHTQDWGRKVIDHFIDSKVGIIGIAGGHFIPNTPSSWDSAHVNSINIIQAYFENGIKKLKHIIELDYLDGTSIEVVAVDGVFFCTKKKLFTYISFDETNFKGFHNYDVDICLQTRAAGFKVLMVSDILIEHFSFGKYNNEWIESSIILHSKWQKYLPQTAGVRLTEEDIKTRETFVRENFLLIKEINNLCDEIYTIRKSKAYRLGKILLKPIKWIKNHKISIV